MSTHLYWQPVAPQKGKTVNDKLKYILKEAYRIDNWNDPVTLNSDNQSYLLGLRDAGIEGVDALLAAIEKHGAIEIWINE